MDLCVWVQSRESLGHRKDLESELHFPYIVSMHEPPTGHCTALDGAMSPTPDTMCVCGDTAKNDVTNRVERGAAAPQGVYYCHGNLPQLPHHFTISCLPRSYTPQTAMPSGHYVETGFMRQVA